MNIHYPEEYIKRIKKNNKLFDVALDYINLKKVSNNLYETLCPFHQEKTPSFRYHTDTDEIHCYGCGIHFGDSIEFIEEIEQLNFQDAVKFLADRSGMELPTKKDNKKLKKRMKFRNLLKRKSIKFYKTLLKSENQRVKRARKYLKKRGFNKKDIKKWKIGFCDFSEKDNKQFRKFCNRIIFTITDRTGNIVGFSGRKLPGSSDKFPKYINSTDKNNPLFNKKSLIYGLKEAKHSIRQLNEVILVEGFTDVIFLNKAGIKNSIATMGTAITEEHIEKLSNYTDNIIMFLDGDESGQEAMKNSIELIEKFDLNIKLVRGKNGMDPDEMVKQFKGKLKKWIDKNSKTVEQYYVDDFLSAYNSKIIDAKRKLINNLSNTFKGKFDELNKEIALGSICKQLDIDIETLKKKINS